MMVDTIRSTSVGLVRFMNLFVADRGTSLYRQRTSREASFARGGTRPTEPSSRPTSQSSADFERPKSASHSDARRPNTETEVDQWRAYGIDHTFGFVF